MPTILFVCSANRYRSPIAATYFKQELNKREVSGKWNVLSAGIWTKKGLPAWPAAIFNARQYGLDIQSHRSLCITAGAIDTADLILVMEDGQKEALQSEFPDGKHKVFLLSEVAIKLPYSIPDPTVDADAGDVSAEMVSLIQDGFDEIIFRALELEHNRNYSGMVS